MEATTDSRCPNQKFTAHDTFSLPSPWIQIPPENSGRPLRGQRENSTSVLIVWSVAREDLPKLMPDSNSVPTQNKYKEQENHELCTFDFCKQSQRDLTAVQQRHECEENDCSRLKGLFSREILTNAAEDEKSTAWRLDGRSMIEPPQPYMAISHVWSDGTGTGNFSQASWLVSTFHKAFW